MISNKDITVINEYKGKYYGFFIKGVSFIGKTTRTATEEGLNTADYFTCRIPESTVISKSLVSPVIYLRTESGENLTTEDAFALQLEYPEKWILRPQKTYIVIGEVFSDELNSITNILKNREVYTVVSASDNRIGSPTVRHWRFDCK